MTLDKRKAKTKSGKADLQWPVYSVGQQLRDDDLNAGIVYTQELNKLLFRSLFGCGVVCGLKVEAKFDHCGRLVVRVNSGIALDACGSAIHIPKPIDIKLDPDCGDHIPKGLYVIARSESSSCGHRETACGCDDQSTSPTRHILGYEIALVQNLPGCKCWNDPRTKVEEPAESAEDVSVIGELKAEEAKRKATAGAKGHDCLCADPDIDGNKDHYAGVCSAFDCDTGEWVVLAAILSSEEDRSAQVNHEVRRFIRPMRMSDPLTRSEEEQYLA
jgi:hypothetical protein